MLIFTFARFYLQIKGKTEMEKLIERVSVLDWSWENISENFHR